MQDKHNFVDHLRTPSPIELEALFMGASASSLGELVFTGLKLRLLILTITISAMFYEILLNETSFYDIVTDITLHIIRLKVCNVVYTRHRFRC